MGLVLSFLSEEDMTYIPILESQTDPEAPIDSTLLKRLGDNPIRIAEGGSGAPRINRLAMEDEGFILHGIVPNTGSFLTQTGLAAVKILNLRAIIASSGAAAISTLRVEFSNNNGSTWGSLINLSSSTPGSGASDQSYVSLDINLDLDTGTYRGLETGSGTTGGAFSVRGAMQNQILTIPAGGANAVRFSRSANTATMTIQLRTVAGRPTY
jgi:hypothetical protein